MSNPHVSVVMAVYNAQKYVSDAIESILCQTYNDFEFIIIEDGSSDESLKIIQSYSDPRIKVIRNKENLKLIKGDYNVTVSKQNVALFEGDMIKYFIALEPNN